jgi:hypothetical protein
VYIENVRNKLSILNGEQKYEIAERTKKILEKQNKIGSNVRTAHILKGLNNFISGKEISLTYFDGYLQALDKLYPSGGEKALLGEKINLRKNWRNTLIRITNDTVAPKLEAYIHDEYILIELKKLFISVVNACIRDTQEETHQTLKVLNKILKNNQGD